LFANHAQGRASVRWFAGDIAVVERVPVSLLLVYVDVGRPLSWSW
jgi:hypothetical protein